MDERKTQNEIYGKLQNFWKNNFLFDRKDLKFLPKFMMLCIFFMWNLS